MLSQVKYFFPSVCSMSSHNTSYGMSFSSNLLSTLGRGREGGEREREGGREGGREEGREGGEREGGRVVRHYTPLSRPYNNYSAYFSTSGSSL